MRLITSHFTPALTGTRLAVSETDECWTRLSYGCHLILHPRDSKFALQQPNFGKLDFSTQDIT